VQEYLTVRVGVAEDVDLKELYEAGCPFVKHLPERFVLDREQVVQALKDGRQAALPNGVTLSVTAGYIVDPKRGAKE